MNRFLLSLLKKIVLRLTQIVGYGPSIEIGNALRAFGLLEFDRTPLCSFDQAKLGGSWCPTHVGIDDRTISFICVKFRSHDDIQ